MNFKTKELYYVNHAHDTMAVNAHTLKSGACPILWNNKGLFCIISGQKVHNLLEIIKDVGCLPVLNKKTVNVFHWEDGAPITARAASMLLS